MSESGKFHMAYSLTDHYRSLRIIMRINGTVTGFGLGLALTVLPRSLLAAIGLGMTGPAWPLRLAGVGLITLGVHMIVAANERAIGPTALVTTLVGSALVALVLLLGYLQRDLGDLFLIGRLILILIVLLSLICALIALRFLREDYGRG